MVGITEWTEVQNNLVIIKAESRKCPKEHQKAMKTGILKKRKSNTVKKVKAI